MKPLTNEKHIQRACLDWLRWNRWFAYRIKEGAYTWKGMPDAFAVKKGRVIFIEFKGPRGKLRPEQERFQQEMELAKGEYYVIRSLEELMEKIGGNTDA